MSLYSNYDVDLDQSWGTYNSFYDFISSKFPPENRIVTYYNSNVLCFDCFPNEVRINYNNRRIHIPKILRQTFEANRFYKMRSEKMKSNRVGTLDLNNIYSKFALSKFQFENIDANVDHYYEIWSPSDAEEMYCETYANQLLQRQRQHPHLPSSDFNKQINSKKRFTFYGEI